jgi:hypothetical protein
VETDPPLLVAVRAYVVLAVGVTVMEPFDATAPIPWLILTGVASVVVQDNVLVPPVVIDVGLADKDAIGNGALSVVTDTAIDVAMLPAPSLAIAVSVWLPLIAVVVFQLTV